MNPPCSFYPLRNLKLAVNAESISLRTDPANRISAASKARDSTTETGA